MIVRYLQLAAWPHALVIDYGLPRQLALVDVLPEAAVILTLLILDGIALVVRPMIGFLGVWFFVTLAPASSVVPIHDGSGRRAADVSAARSGGRLAAVPDQPRAQYWLGSVLFERGNLTMRSRSCGGS